MFIHIAPHIRIGPMSPFQILVEAGLEEAPPSHLWAWGWLLAYAGSIKSRTFAWQPEAFARQSHCTPSVMMEAASLLEAAALIEWSEDGTEERRVRKQIRAPSLVPRPELFDEHTKALLVNVGRPSQDAWLALYDAEWIKVELKKAHAWCIANPQKTPRSHWARFLTAWLSRAYEWQRRSKPSSSTNKFGQYVAPVNTVPIKFEDL